MSRNAYTKQYFWGDTVYGIGSSTKTELSNEEKLKRIEDYIEKYNIEHDEKYIYLYKAVNVDGTNIHNQGNTIVYEVGKVYTEKCDQDVKQSCSYGLHAGTYEIALDFGKGNNNSNYVYSTTLSSWNSVYLASPSILETCCKTSPKNKPVNPQKLYNDFNFRIFKVKIYKEHVVVPNNTDGKVRCNQMEIIEEVKLEPKLTYILLNIEQCDIEKTECTYKFTYRVNNKLNNQSLEIVFTSIKLDLSQEEISNKIKARIKEMQRTYDMFEELSKFDGSELV